MAQQAMGTKLQIGANSIVELTSIGGMEISADTIETTTLDSNGWRTFIQGLKDAGEVSMSGFFVPGDTTGQVAVYNALVSGAVQPFTILFPATLGASWLFNAVVTDFSTSAEMEDGITFEAKVKVSGAPTLGLTPSADLSALALTGTAGALTPTFAGATYAYSFSFTGGSCTVTATRAAANIKLYVDGVYVQDLVSGSPSNAIAFGAVGSKLLTIVENESGKTQKVYDIVAIRTA